MSTTINSYSVGLTLDASDYINKAGMSSTETRRLSRAIEQARDPSEKFGREQDRLNRALEKGAIDQQVYNRLLDSARAKYGQAERAAKGWGSSVSTVNRSLVAAGNKIVEYRAGLISVAIAIAGAAAALTKMNSIVRDSQNEIDKLAKQSTKLGLSYNEFSGLAFAAGEIGGLQADQVDLAITQLQVRMARAVDGDTKIQDAFAKVGVDAADAMQKGPLYAIDQIAKGFGNVNSQSEKLEIAMTLLGKSGTDFVSILDAGSDALSESVAFHEKWLGLTDAQTATVEVTNDTYGRISAIVGGLVDRFSAELAPAMLLVAERTVEWADSLDGIDKVFTGIVDVWTGFLGGEEAYLDLLKKRLKMEHAAEQKRRDRETERERLIARETDAVEEINDSLEIRAQLEERINDEQTKRAQSLNKEFDEFVKEADEAFNRNIESAIDAAKRYFEDEKRKADKIREDIAKGAGAGMEAGSSEAAKFLADQVNGRIAAEIMPPTPTPGEREIAEEARKQLMIMQAQSEKQDQQIAVLKNILAESKENRFARIR